MSEKKPSHYYRNGVEVREILELIFKFFGDDVTAEEGGVIFNIVKYLMRYKFKGNPIKDLDKLSVYLDWLKDLEKKEAVWIES